jgi:hypothetical protein
LESVVLDKSVGAGSGADLVSTPMIAALSTGRSFE